MMDENGGITNKADTISFLKEVEGVFLFIDKVKQVVMLFGNNKEVLGFEDNIVVIGLDQLLEMIDTRQYAVFNSLLEDTEITNKHIELSIKNRNRVIKWIDIKGRGRNIDGISTGFEGYISDITKEKEDSLGLNNTYALDQITGLHNRSFMQKRINTYFEKNKDKDMRSALVILGLDNFKYINDSFGDKCGDKFLNIISQELKKIISEDSLCRFEGDEFLIFVPYITSVQDAEVKAKAIVEVFNKSYNIEGKQIFITTSIGVSIYPDDGVNFNTLLKNADAAMFMAKNNGKNQYQFFNENISRELDKVYSIQKGLITALQKEEMFVVFQPKVILEKERVNGFEALLRWKNEELGFVSPMDFIPIAEITGLIVPIGKFVLTEVFRRAKTLLDEGYDDFKIAFNLSEVQLRDGSIVDHFKMLSKMYSVSGKYIEIEITETMLVKSFERNIKYLMQFKELGATIALDDFGTGYSSLNHLTKLPIDVLKIDRSFVVDMTNNHKSRWIVENIIELSHKLGIEVVAEGVEIQEQVDYLKEIYCDTVQGYFYSKPESFEKVIELLGK